MSRRRSARVFVGNLPEDIKKREIDDIFYKYGRIRDIDIKFPRERDQPAFAFLEFDDERDAEGMCLCCVSVCLFVPLRCPLSLLRYRFCDSFPPRGSFFERTFHCFYSL